MFRLFKGKKKVTKPEKTFNEVMLEAGLYQLLVRYIDLEYNLPDVHHYRPMRNCPYILTGRTNLGKMSIKLNTDLCKGPISFKDYYDIMVMCYNGLVTLLDEDPLKDIETTKTKECYIADKILGICTTLMKVKHRRSRIIFIDEMRQNHQIHSILKENRRKGIDLPTSIIFHECKSFICEETFNVTTITLADDEFLGCIESALMVYTGTHFDPAERTAPTVPSLDYIIARSFYARNKIGREEGYEQFLSNPSIKHNLYIARSEHFNRAHRFCVDFLSDYYVDLQNRITRMSDNDELEESYIEEDEETVEE